MHYIRHMRNATSKSYDIMLNLSRILDSEHLRAVTSQIKWGTCENRRMSWVTENLLQGDSNLDSQNQLELKVNTSIYLTTLVNTDV